MQKPTKFCKWCGSEFAPQPGNAARGRGLYCSHSCAGHTATATHGETRDRKLSPEYQAWKNLKSRCLNPKRSDYHHYGGRGITVCGTWVSSFDAFLEDVGRRPSGIHTLERINNDKNYEPGNCRWATRREQAKNRRSNVWVTLDGTTRCLSDWAAFLEISYLTVWKRLRRGQTVERALQTPLRVTSRTIPLPIR